MTTKKKNYYFFLKEIIFIFLSIYTIVFHRYLFIQILEFAKRKKKKKNIHKDVLSDKNCWKMIIMS